jgi:hypothetical protein
MQDKTYETESEFPERSEYTYCEYEGHLINQGIRMCMKELPNDADILHCGPECPCYSPKTIVSYCGSTSSATMTITNNETYSETD